MRPKAEWSVVEATMPHNEKGEANPVPHRPTMLQILLTRLEAVADDPSPEVAGEYGYSTPPTPTEILDGARSQFEEVMENLWEPLFPLFTDEVDEYAIVKDGDRWLLRTGGAHDPLEAPSDAWNAIMALKLTKLFDAPITDEEIRRADLLAAMKRGKI